MKKSEKIVSRVLCLGSFVMIISVMIIFGSNIQLRDVEKTKTTHNSLSSEKLRQTCSDELPAESALVSSNNILDELNKDIIDERAYSEKLMVTKVTAFLRETNFVKMEVSAETIYGLEEEELQIVEDIYEFETVEINVTEFVDSETVESVDTFSSEIEYEFTEEEILLIQQIVESEISGENEEYYEGKVAVVNVILNRLNNELFPDTISEVIFAENQFQPVENDYYLTVTISELTKKAVEAAITGTSVIPEDVMYFCTKTASGKSWFENNLEKYGYVNPHDFYYVD